MNLASFILLALKLSIILTVVGFALKARPESALYLFRKPGELIRALLSMNIIMPLVALALVFTFNFKPPVKVALFALAVSPVPPILPRKALMSGGTENYTIGLLVAASLFSTVVIPLTMWLCSVSLGIPLSMSPGKVALVVLTSVLAPLAIGITIQAVVPAFAEKAAGPLGMIGLALLILSLLPVLFLMRPAIFSLIGDGTLIGMVFFAIAGLAIGYLLGGPDHENRTVLGMATSARHPAVAIAIALANFPNQQLAPAAVLLYVIVGAFVSIPYIKWAGKTGLAAVHNGGHHQAKA